MAIEKICGIETEYGISVQGAVDFNPILTSSLLINAYAKPAFKRVRWDYEEENPLRDARGFDRAAPEAAPEDDSGLVNIILPNGSRYYVDHAHPEYSSPECSERARLRHLGQGGGADPRGFDASRVSYRS